MYINVDNLLNLPNPLCLPLLLVLKRATKFEKSALQEKVEKVLTNEADLEKLIEEGYIKHIKGLKKDSPLIKLRLDKKGTQFLHSLDEPMVEEEDVKIFEWLAEIYKSRDKEVGNGKKTKLLISSFREKSGIEKNKLAFLCREFIYDDGEQEYSHKLEYVFWKPKNLFQSRFVLEDSRLWSYYQKKKDFFDKQFKKLG